jgi:hypothetical protein
MYPTEQRVKAGVFGIQGKTLSQDDRDSVKYHRIRLPPRVFKNPRRWAQGRRARSSELWSRYAQILQRILRNRTC